MQVELLSGKRTSLTASRARPRPASVAQDPAPDPQHAVTCFTPGTLVTTLQGKRRVEALRPGDRLLTRDRGFRPLVWRGIRPARSVTPSESPVLVRAGALGNDRPDRDMVVSPGHRFLVTDRRLLRGLGEPEALVEASALTDRPGIGWLGTAVSYVHLLLEQHEVILSENTWTESFRLSESVARTLHAAGPEDVLSLYPQLRAEPRTAVQAPARMLLSAQAWQHVLSA